MVTVVVVPYPFQASRFEPVRLVNDQQLRTAAGTGLGVHEGVDDSTLGVVHRVRNLLTRVGKTLVDLPYGCGDIGRASKSSTSRSVRHSPDWDVGLMREFPMKGP